MPVEIGVAVEQGAQPGTVRPTRFTGPRGFHPGALGLAAAAALLATLMLIAQIAS